MTEDILRDASDVEDASSSSSSVATFDPSVYELPTGALRSTQPRRDAVSQITPTTGVCAASAISLEQGDLLTSAKIYSVGSSTGLTHSWAALLDSTGTILAVSNDDTTQWSAATVRIFTLSSPYTVTTTGLYWIGLVEVGTSLSSVVAGQAPTTAVRNATPILCATIGSGLTTPSSVGTDIGSYAGMSSGRLYAELY